MTDHSHLAQGPPSAAATRRLAGGPHHQRSASTGSHNLLFSAHHHHTTLTQHLLQQQQQQQQSTGSPDLLSDEDEDWEASAANVSNGAPELQGTLSKWTNYIHGWQDRYMALKDGTLVYFKSEVETDFGCRGAISIDKAAVKQHELDDLRFDVSVSDCVWYLRASSVEDRQRWIEAIEGHKRYLVDLNNVVGGGENGGGGGGSGHISTAASNQILNNLRRHDSALSLTSTASKGGFRGSSAAGQHYRGLAEKLAEIETFRDILCRQIDTLQSYFDACSDAAQNAQESENAAASTASTENVNKETTHVTKELVMQHGIHAMDFKGEAITFKATTAGILATMSHCIEMMTHREEQWRKKLEREQIARRRLEEKYKHAVDKAEEAKVETSALAGSAAAAPASATMATATAAAAAAAATATSPPKSSSNKMMMVGGAEYEEGPNSQIGEDEFFDAVENALDKLQEEQDYRDKMKLMSAAVTRNQLNNLEIKSEATQHQLWPTIDKVTNEQLHYARMKVGEGVWELFAEDGEMRMYKREEEKDGLVVDPLKALHSVRGVTARELCNYFFAPEFRMEWETTVEQVSVLEKLAPDTLIFLQLHKRVWPAAQRDALFWSHMRHISGGGGASHQDEDGPAPDDVWMVTNQSTKHPDAPENQGGCLRVGLTVCFVCDTYVDPPFTKETAGRNNLHTKITYCSVVNPGGWAPAAVLRTVFKREYPRFLKRFTQYVIDKSKDKPIMW